ncbi:DUF6850 family outer membrane beta-barrel protein [Myroides injenensis]|uniref:DUF6850 family outer membrane beta-barrel protein n=1 Tax=Myroides injenensis TaxID=1183151 RepID=UPI00226E447A|nr:DUF6850 family outer membrane beta-barrel protein [Myroides injenensis]
MKINKLFFLIIVCLPLQVIYGQQRVDSLSFFRKIENQYQIEREFKSNYYYNPANKLDYSNFSFSNFEVAYNKQRDKKYLLQGGDDKQTFAVRSNSYKRIKDNQVLWGAVSYQNQKQKNVQWNSIIDLDKIGPYALGDSVKGINKMEVYSFTGGYAKAFNRFGFGLSMRYNATSNYRDSDPRPKSTSSDILISLGASYNFYKQYKVSFIGAINHYTQDTNVSYVSKIRKAAAYQMIGLGVYNNFFSNAPTTAYYRGNGYTTGLSLGRENDIALNITYSKSNLEKEAKRGNGNEYYTINELDTSIFTIEAIKQISFSNHTILGKVKYDNVKKDGIDVLYSNNTSYITKLLEKKLYKYQENNTLIEALYKYDAGHYTLSVQPFFSYQKVKEHLKEYERRQEFTYNNYGVDVAYMQQLNKKNLLTIKPYLALRKATKSVNALKIEDNKEGIKQWLINDFEVLSSDYTTYGAVLRYDYFIKNNVGLYISGDLQKLKYKNYKSNDYYGVTLGVTF